MTLKEDLSWLRILLLIQTVKTFGATKTQPLCLDRYEWEAIEGNKSAIFFLTSRKDQKNGTCELRFTTDYDETLSLSVEEMFFPCDYGRSNGGSRAIPNNYLQFLSHENKDIAGIRWCGKFKGPNLIYVSPTSVINTEGKNYNQNFNESIIVSIFTTNASQFGWNLTFSFEKRKRPIPPELLTKNPGGNVTFVCYDAIEKKQGKSLVLKHFKIEGNITKSTDSHRLRVQPGHGKTTFILNNATREEQGIYECWTTLQSTSGKEVNLRYQSYRLELEDDFQSSSLTSNVMSDDKTKGPILPRHDSQLMENITESPRTIKAHVEEKLQTSTVQGIMNSSKTETSTSNLDKKERVNLNIARVNSSNISDSTLSANDESNGLYNNTLDMVSENVTNQSIAAATLSDKHEASLMSNVNVTIETTTEYNFEDESITLISFSKETIQQKDTPSESANRKSTTDSSTIEELNVTVKTAAISPKVSEPFDIIEEKKHDRSPSLIDKTMENSTANNETIKQFMETLPTVKLPLSTELVTKSMSKEMLTQSEFSTRYDGIITTAETDVRVKETTLVFILITVCVVAAILATIFLFLGCLRRRQKAKDVGVKNSADDSKSVTSLSIVRHPKGSSARPTLPISPTNEPPTLQQNYGWVFSSSSMEGLNEENEARQRHSLASNNNYKEPSIVVIAHGPTSFYKRGQLPSRFNPFEWPANETIPLPVGNELGSRIGSVHFGIKSPQIPVGLPDPPGSLTSFFLDGSEKEYRSRLDEWSDTGRGSRHEEKIDVGKLSQLDKVEGSSLTGTTSPPPEDDDLQGDVTFDFRSETGSFAGTDGSPFERNWRSESEKLTGCSYV